jgi:hypothetical protein
MQLWGDIEERLFMISEPFTHLERVMSEFGNTGACNSSTDDKQAHRLRMQQMYAAEDKLKAKTVGSTDLLELISESASLAQEARSEPAKHSFSRVESDHVPAAPHTLDAATFAGCKQSTFSSSSNIAHTLSTSHSSPTKNAHRSWASLGSCTDRSSI